MRHVAELRGKLRVTDGIGGHKGALARIEWHLHRWLDRLATLILLWTVLAGTGICRGLSPSSDDEISPGVRNLYTHRVCVVDPGRPEVSAFDVALENAGVPTWRVSRTGRNWLVVAERDWREAQSIATSIGFTTLSAHGPVASPPSYPETIRQSLFSTNWVAMQKQLVAMEPPSGETVNPAIARALEECEFRLHLEENAVHLPIALEWRKMAGAMQRRESTDYLLDRVALSRGDRVVNGLVIPGSIQNIEYAEMRGKRYVVQGIADDASIDPFVELYKLDLTADELQAFVPVLTTEHTFIPIEEALDKPIRLIPSSRYCCCVIINSVLGRPNVIREYDLTDEEWRDPEKVAALIEKAKASVAEK